MTKITSDARQVLAQIAGSGAQMRKLLAQERANLEVARQIFALRNQAGLSQQQLAKRLGTTQSAVSRLEDAAYDGHSLTMLRRIAAALDQRVEIRFLPTARKRLQPA